MTRGRFITLEGIEGAGKSTLAAGLREVLLKRGIDVHLTREPGGTPVAERIRRIVLERGEETMAPEAEVLLMFAARRVHVDNVIRPRLAAGTWVICDRFTDATRAYQGGGRGVDEALIERLAAAVHDDLLPDCTLLLDLEPTVGLGRVRQRGATPDRFEAETLAFFERVRARYLRIAAAEPFRVTRLDATLPPDAVLENASRKVLELIDS